MYIVLPGPDDVPLQYSNGLYQQSVTLTARMWPPIEAGSPKTFWGLPAIIWGFIACAILLFILILTALFLCCWLLPRRRKILSPNRFHTTTNPVNGGEIIMAHHTSVVAKTWSESNNYLVTMPSSMGIVPPQYNAPPPPPPIQYASSSSPICGVGSSHHQILPITQTSNCSSSQNIPDTHKSMWAINASNTALNEIDSAYRTRSLPVWGKSKPRPVSTTDDLEELYAKVNFSKKRKNRMRNGEAAIIALCRSRSQNLQGLPLEREGVVVYDERTAL